MVCQANSINLAKWKKLTVLWVAFTAMAMQASVDESLRQAYLKGADAKVIYRVVDDGGIPVVGATAHVWFRTTYPKNVYHADTNATYCQSFVYSFDRYPAKRPISVELGEDEYLVFRTRTAVDENGRLVSANYGVLYGPWCFVGPRGMNIPFLLLNPTPNDTNLEDSEILNRVKRMGR